MAMIQVKTPSGFIEAQIAGDVPTEEESKNIMDFVKNSTELSTPAKETDAEMDPFNMDPKAASDYYRTRRQLGKATSKLPENAEQGVDYTSGVDNVEGFSRFGYGRMETDKERENYLTDKIGKDGFRQDSMGRFVITKKGRATLGMGEGPEVSVDEAGLSWGDVKDFLGSVGVPLATGLTAGILTGGIGFVPAAGAAFVAGFAGKALDEGVEYAQGLQDQSFSDVMRDSALEGVFGVVGEGVGRAISKAAGRLIKGPGGEANEVARADMRRMIEEGFRPTVGGAMGEDFRPVLNRLQAIYEGIFPNKAAAEKNLSLIVKEMQALRTIPAGSVDDLVSSVSRDIEAMYATSTQKLANAQKGLDDTTNDEMAKVLSGLKKDGAVPKNLVEMLAARKRMFDESMDTLYTEANEKLSGQAIINTSGIKSSLRFLTMNTAADIESSKFARMVEELPEFATVLDVTKIRTMLQEATYNPSLVADVNVGALSSLRKSITNALNNTELELKLMANAGPVPIRAGEKIVDPMKFTGTFQEMGEALALLRRTNDIYRKGVRRFDNVVTQKIIRQGRLGQLNEKFIFEQVIEKDNPEALRQLLLAVRGASDVEFGQLGPGAKTQASQLINGKYSLADAKNRINALPEGDTTRRMLQQQVSAMEARTAENATLRRTGAENAENLRQTLAYMTLQKAMLNSTVENATGQKVVNSLMLSAELRSQGKTFNTLFRGEKNELNNMLDVLERGKADLAPDVIADLQARNAPLTAALTALRQQEKESAATAASRFFKDLNSGNPDLVADTVMRSPYNVKEAQKALSPEAMERVKDAAMGKILRDSGVALSENGEVKMTQDFIDAFRSGRLGNRLQGIINQYEDTTINSLFGPGMAKALNGVASDMIKVSNQAMSGKGGLTAANIATSLGMVALITNPLSTLPAAAGYWVMAKALRNPIVLKGLAASRNPNTVRQFMAGKLASDHPMAQAAIIINGLISRTTAATVRGAEEQSVEEARPYVRQAQQQAQQALANPQLQAGMNQGSSAVTQLGQNAKQAMGKGLNALGNANPIVLPNPTDQALAEALASRQ